ncbi:MAG: hypothetical protein U0V56_07465 [Actinomycetota bacterium]
MATAGMVLLMVHVGGLLVDRFVPFGMPGQELAIPMRSSYRPVAISRRDRRHVRDGGRPRFVVDAQTDRNDVVAAHAQLAVPVFILALLHGVFSGSDTERPWMYWLYVTTGLTTLFLVIVRGLTAGYRPAQPTRPGAGPAGARSRHA